MDVDCIGAIKVKDGLFIGDQYAGQVQFTQDLEFVVANKVTHVINCSGTEVPNHWEPIGVKYLTYPWADEDSEVVFDSHDVVFQTVFEFVEGTMKEGESVLILSLKGVGRCCLLATAYLLCRFRWSLNKSLDFMQFRQPALRLNPGFLRQLQQLEVRLSRAGLGPTTRTWNETMGGDEEEEIVTNTYLNAQGLGIADYVSPVPGMKVDKLKWADGNLNDVRELEDIVHPSAKNPVEMGCAILKSCLKGGRDWEIRVPLQILKIKSQKVLAPSDYANKTQSSSLKVAIEYGKVNKDENSARGAKKGPVVPRPASASKRENSPLISIRDPPLRASSAKRESPSKSSAPPTLLDRKRGSARPVPNPEPPKQFSSLLYTKSVRPMTTPQRLRSQPGEQLTKGPVKVPSAGNLKKAVWK